jgi:hypothetical protein
MKHISIVRKKPNADGTGTPGTLTVAGSAFNCDTLELIWANNERGRSCIIADVYKGVVWLSPTLGRLVIRLEDKHGRQACLIHNGNFAGDETHGQFTQIHGCTEVGRGYGQVPMPNGGTQYGIRDSKNTLAALINDIGVEGTECEVTYTWADGCCPDSSAVCAPQ